MSRDETEREAADGRATFKPVPAPDPLAAELLAAERDLLAAGSSAERRGATAHRDLAGARQLARWLWRLDGVRQQWTPPAKCELDWLPRDESS